MANADCVVLRKVDDGPFRADGRDAGPQGPHLPGRRDGAYPTGLEQVYTRGGSTPCGSRCERPVHTRHDHVPVQRALRQAASAAKPCRPSTSIGVADRLPVHVRDADAVPDRRERRRADAERVEFDADGAVHAVTRSSRPAPCAAAAESAAARPGTRGVRARPARVPPAPPLDARLRVRLLHEPHDRVRDPRGRARGGGARQRRRRSGLRRWPIAECRGRRQVRHRRRRAGPRLGRDPGRRRSQRWRRRPVGSGSTRRTRTTGADSLGVRRTSGPTRRAEARTIPGTTTPLDFTETSHGWEYVLAREHATRTRTRSASRSPTTTRTSRRSPASSGSCSAASRRRSISTTAPSCS